MRACIHRGSNQIGGSCVEVESGGQRLIIDVGLPLDAESNDASYLPNVQGLDGDDPSLRGILVSHPHLDHFGLLAHVSPDIPVGMGAAGRSIVRAAAPFLPGSWTGPSAGWNFESGVTIDIAPFRITPFLVDHSAYDAYALLIEADGRRLFYSGDFRAHGRKAALFGRFVEHPPAPVDVLLIEGSSLGRLDMGGHFPSESEIESQLVGLFRETDGMVLVHSSAQNIDRIVSLFRACKRSGRTLIIDLYTAAVLEATGNPKIPQSFWPELVLFIPQYQRIQIKRNAQFDLLKRHSRHRIFAEDLQELARSSVLLFRLGHCADLDDAECLAGASYIYSLWEGYWQDGSYDRLRGWLDRHKIPKRSIHTSGHASPADLKLFAAALSPGKVVPIHTFMPERYPELFEHVELHDDGEWWEV
ncbi:MAG TPA: MBL fold metallo-hydrolase [Thermodesulfobacteriota bacterium]|nr:MBL fold metallo-hydrolase [Thermodesulfobacteriota bacterium]HOC38614.1 MBL fold metallo-hydrolase [Thermodesulfobacteriota bacterium]HQO78781.1 MBL fold metallo-hydrolase [Thermodesulfobacteriota bacterium]